MIQRITCRARVVGLIAAIAFGATATPAAAQDTAAVAVNTKDGSTLFRFAFSVRQIMGDVVDQTNAAVAYASCNECTTVAISIQVLLVSGSPDQVTPTNLAVALNEDCTECQTLAAAYQFVFGNGQELRFTADGRKQIADIRRRFLELRKAGLSLEETQAQAAALAGELRGVLANEVTVRGSGDPAPESGTTGSPTPQGTNSDADPGTGTDASSTPAGTATSPATTTNAPTQTTPTESSPASTTPTQSTPAQTTTTPDTASPPPSTGTTAP